MIVENRTGNVAVVRPAGRIDRLAAPVLEAELQAVVAGGAHRLVVDLGGVDFIDSSGIGALINGLRASRMAGGDLRVAQLDERAGELFRLTSLDRVLRIYGTVEQALGEYD